MTMLNPLFLDALTYAAKYDRWLAKLLLSEGIFASGAFAVTQNSSPGMSVFVAAGNALIQNDSSDAGSYIVTNDASMTKSIAAADPSNPRIDRVILQMYDSTDISGALDKCDIEVLTGTPAGSPSAPAIPSNAISLATVAVAAGATQVVTANITDTRAIVGFQSGIYTFSSFPVTPSSAPTTNYQVANKKYVDDSIAGFSADGSFWTTVPGTPTRVSDSQFTITDTSNANKYDLLFKKGTIIRWLESTTFQWAMVVTSSYGANTVTIDIIGDSLTAGFTTMKYAKEKALFETFIIPGVLAIGTDLAKTWYTPYPICVFSSDFKLKTAPSGANATTIDINDDGTTMFTTKPSLAAAGTSDINNVSDNVETVVAEGSLITVDVDAVCATTPGTEAYIYLFYCPEAWRYTA